jgi:hypothetical protein
VWLKLCAVASDDRQRPNWDHLYEIAATQEGLITTRQAVANGYSPQLLVHHVHAGRLERVFVVGSNEGMRFRAECQLAGKIFGQPFGVDVAFGDPIQGEPQLVDAKDTLDFIGVKPPRLRLYPIETHIAEKLPVTRCSAFRGVTGRQLRRDRRGRPAPRSRLHDHANGTVTDGPGMSELDLLKA